jgi:hypothetical protein
MSHLHDGWQAAYTAAAKALAERPLTLPIAIRLGGIPIRLDPDMPKDQFMIVSPDSYRGLRELDDQASHPDWTIEVIR